MMPPLTGNMPPLKPVPAPRAMKGTLCLFASLTIAEISCVVVGKTTTSGSALNTVAPSHS